MKTFVLMLASLCAAGCAMSGADHAKRNAGGASKPVLSGVIKENLDSTVRPQDDFYLYVNGGWLKRTEIPPDRSNYGSFTLLQDQAEADLRAILEESAQAEANAGTDAQKAGDFYASFMDEARVEAAGLTPLSNELEQIKALDGFEKLAGYIGHLQRMGVAAPFAYYVSIDEKNSSTYVSYITQAGLGLPDRDYYLVDDERMKGIRKKYQRYIGDLLAAADTPDAAKAAERILALETRLAKAQWTRVENRDVEKTYNRYDIPAASKLTPGFNWSAFLAGAQASKADALVIAQPSYFNALAKEWADVSLAQWKDYLRFHLLDAYAPYLATRFVDLNFDFQGRTLSGVAELKPRWKRGVGTVEESIGELAGKIYVERHFSPEAKVRIDALVGNLLAAFSAGIDDLQWMTPATKKEAHVKLARFATKIGYPQTWKDWSALQVRSDDLVGNIMRASAVNHDRAVARLGGPVDKAEWLMTPQTVNAYYNPPANEIVFPAAILQPPFFNVQAEDAINYGAIGAVIGHEISHGFDDQGRKYDGDGNLHDWWAPADEAQFRVRAEQLVAQYSACSPLPGLQVNGEFTLGENIADVSGLAIAHKAYRRSLDASRGPHAAPVLDGFSGDQRFYIGWAQGWARKYREDDLRKRLLTDPHSPSEFRANVTVSNQASFYEAFGVQPEDKMFRPEKERVTIW